MHMAHPGVRLCRVIGVPDQPYDEQIAASVEFSGQGPVPRDDELRAWVREKLAQFKQPKCIWCLGQREVLYGVV